MKIAQYKHIQYDYVQIAEVQLNHSGEDYQEDGTVVRISEPLEVEFTPREDVVAVQLAVLDKLEKAERVKLQEKLEKIQEKRSELLGLPFISASKPSEDDRASDIPV